MADKKITQLTNITGANLVDADEFVVVDISVDETKSITLAELKTAFDSGSGFVRITGDTMSGDLTFGDNDKAIFGAGSDLQIYHDGSHSYVSDQGTGNIKVLADDFVLKNSADTANMIVALTGGAATLYHDGDTRLATTSTGVDVTGTVTADGLTVDGAVVFNEASADVDFRVESNGNTHMLFVDGGNDAVGIGTNTPTDTLNVQAAAAGTAITLVESSDSGSNPAAFIGYRSRGTDLSGHTAIQADNTMTQFSAGAHDGNAFAVGSKVISTASQTWTTSAHGTRLGIFTTSDGSTTPAERMRIDSLGNVGIGVTPDAANGSYLQFASGYFAGQYGFGKNSYFDGSNYRAIATGGATLIQGGDNFLFYTAPSVSADANQTFAERMRLTNAGDLLVGTTTTQNLGTTNSGSLIRDGFIQVATTEANANLLYFYGASGQVGSIVTQSGNIILASGSVGVGVGDDNLYPTNGSGASTDNVMDVGDASARFDDIFATNGTIQTSDRNEKQDIAALTSAEMLVAKRISALFKTFRWKDKVAAKGNDARTHTGIIAQDVQAAFTAEGLDAGDYSLFISSTWWEHDVDVPAVEAADAVYEDVVIAAVEEELDEEGNVLVEAQEERTEQRLITEAVEAVDAYTRTDTYDTQSEAPEGATSRTRLGIRYPELLSFVAAYNEQRFAAIETRLTALENA